MAVARKTRASRQETGLVLNKEEYESMKRFFESPDEGDHEVGRRLLWRCDIPKSIYWIRRLAKDTCPTHMVYDRLKAGREFRDESNIWGLYHFNDEQFAKWLIKQGWMTNEIFG